MAPSEMEPPAPAPARRRVDRLSALNDGVAGHILSFLPNKEAARAALLASRWRYVFCNVHTISFEEREGERANDWTTFYYDAEERKSCSWRLLNAISSALLCRRLCAGVHVPLRSFHFAFDSYHWWDGVHVDQWLTYVLRHSSQELHLDLRFRIGSICHISAGGDDDDDGKNGEADSASEDEMGPLRDRWTYLLPPRLFTCAALRTLCISYCRMKLPEAIQLPHLESLRVTGICYNSGKSIQRLISSCPRLVDLALEAIYRLKSVSIIDKRLRKFALRCCHGVKNVAIDASELTCLDYCGAVPAESLWCWHGSPPALSSCNIDFCNACSKETDRHVKFAKFLEKISSSKNLHLHHRTLDSSFFAGFPSFLSLTRLVLQGCIKSYSSVYAVRMILEQSPNLEVLSFYMDELRRGRVRGRWYGYEEEEEEDDDDGDQRMAPANELMFLDESSFSIPCLRHRVREINMVHYMGDELQKMMARMLLRNALVLQRMCVVFVKGPFEFQAALKNEIESWLVVDAMKIFL